MSKDLKEVKEESIVSEKRILGRKQQYKSHSENMLSLRTAKRLTEWV